MRHRLCLLTLAASLGAPCAADDDRRPDVLLIIADDLGYGDLGCYGAPDCETPVLDQLAREGVRFATFYSNGPECTPTRAALMTGRYQHRIGGLECAIGTHNVGRYDDAIRLAEQNDLGLPQTEVTLPERLKEAGYHTALFGKWHLGYEDKFWPRQHGFDRAFGILGGNCDYFRHTEDDGWNVLFRDDELTTAGGYFTDLVTDAAIDWYQSVSDSDRPFFMDISYTAPHTPIQPPGSDTGELVSKEDWNKGSYEDYAAMIEHMDKRIGDLLEALRHNPGRETLIIFMSDNGGTRLARNDPYSDTKSTTFEGGIRVPCIVSWPGRLPEGQVVTHPAITMDFTCSLTRIGEAPLPEDRPFDGIDILAQIEQDEPIRERTLFWRGRRGDRTWRAVRHGNLKRIWRHDGDEVESWLFDLKSDPSEEHDLLAERTEEAAHLESLIEAWSHEVAPTR